MIHLENKHKILLKFNITHNNITY